LKHARERGPRLTCPRGAGFRRPDVFRLIGQDHLACATFPPVRWRRHRRNRGRGGRDRPRRRESCAKAARATPIAFCLTAASVCQRQRPCPHRRRGVARLRAAGSGGPLRLIIWRPAVSQSRDCPAASLASATPSSDAFNRVWRPSPIPRAGCSLLRSRKRSLTGRAAHRIVFTKADAVPDGALTRARGEAGPSIRWRIVVATTSARQAVAAAFAPLRDRCHARPAAQTPDGRASAHRRRLCAAAGHPVLRPRRLARHSRRLHSRPIAAP